MIKVEPAVWNATTLEELAADYHYYVGYKVVMYGADVWIVPWGRFVKEYPRWCPVWKVDLDLLRCQR